MQLASDYRIWISDNRDAELAIAAERARIAAEREGTESGRAAGGNLLSRLRRRHVVHARPVTR